MSRPHYWWWGAVRSAIYQYKDLEQKKKVLQEQEVTTAIKADYVTASGSVRRPTESHALMALTRQEEQIVSAVAQALMVLRSSPGGHIKAKLIEEYYFSPKKRRLPDVAYQCHVSEATAWRWNAAFVRSVAVELGYLWPYSLKIK